MDVESRRKITYVPRPAFPGPGTYPPQPFASYSTDPTLMRGALSVVSHLMFLPICVASAHTLPGPCVLCSGGRALQPVLGAGHVSAHRVVRQCHATGDQGGRGGTTDRHSHGVQGITQRHKHMYMYMYSMFV